MADAIVRLKVESQEYDAKVKRAAEGLKHFQEECRRVGGTLEYVEKEDLAFVKALGSMETKATSSRQQMREFTEAIMDLQMQYKSLTDAEKASPFGQALQASINQLKARGGELKDMMGDLNEELTHIASDTAFTDGVNLMTRTIGACSSAMVAWGGSSQTMEEMIKSLAKIQTTVGAVEALTKAFQKQNLVLLKNPYVAAAAGAVALAIALGKVIGKMTEQSQVQKDIEEVQRKGQENAAKEVTRIEQLNSILHDNTRSNEERRTALEAIQALVPDYHGALTEEGTLINDNTGAIDDYINGLKRAATAQAAFDKMVELQKKKMEKQTELGKAEKDLTSAKSMQQAQTTVVTGGAGAISGMSAAGISGASNVAAAQGAVDSINKEINAIDDEIQALSDLTKAADIAGDAVKKVNDSTTKSGGASASGAKGEKSTFKFGNGSGMPEAGSLADLERQAQMIQNSMGGAMNAAEYKEMNDALEEVYRQMDEIKGKNQEVADSFDTVANKALKVPDAMANFSTGLNAVSSMVGAFDGVKNSVEGMIDTLNSDADAYSKTMSVFSAGMSVLQGMVTIYETINTLKGIFSTLSMANVAAQQAETTAVVAGTAAEVTATTTQTSADAVATGVKAGKASASAGDAVAGIPIVGPILAVAAVAAVLAAVLAAVSKAKSGAGSYAEGGIIPGTSFSGDNLMANVNSGELILNRAQQASIAGQLQQGSNIANGTLSTRIKGGDILIALDNTNRSRGGSRGTYAYSK